MRKRYTPVKTLLTTVVALALAGTVIAADISRDSAKRMSAAEYNESVKNTKSEYDAALKACGDTRGVERTNCRKEARVARDRAMADARSQRGPSSERATRSGEPRSPNETAGASGGGSRTSARDSNMPSPRTPQAANETAGTSPDKAGRMRGGMSRAERTGAAAGAGNPPATTPKSPNETAPSK